MNSELKKALEVLRDNCSKFDNCEDKCDFSTHYGCYLKNRTPEEYSEEDIKCQRNTFISSKKLMA